MSLEDVRETIDTLDAEIVRLLDRRAKAGREAADAKKRLGLPLHNPVREMEVLRRLASLSDGSMPAAGLKNIYRVIMAETLASEQPDNNACPGHHAGGGKRDAVAEILENIEAAPGFFRMRLRAPELANAFAPGQFFQLRLDDHAGQPFLRRPFAPSENDADGLAFYYAVVGGGTRLMASLAPGTRVGVLAPLGNSYTLLPSGSRALIIGGGCGAPSLNILAQHLHCDGVKTTVLIGARTASALIGHGDFNAAAERVILATDDGSQGCRGTTIDAYRLDDELRREKVDRIYACGPLPMLRAAAELAAEKGVDCEVSLEERMACGFGVCMGCAVPLRAAATDGGITYRRVCHEGPVFKASDLAWESMGKR